MVIKKIISLFFVILLIALKPCFAQEIEKNEYTLSEITLFVQDLQKELNMDSYRILVKSLKEKNAMVTSFPFGKSVLLCINIPWFNSLSLEGRRFLIGHELMHLQRHHIPKSIFFSILFPSLEHLVFPLIPFWLKKKKKANLFEHLLISWYSRRCEKDADVQCAKRLHCAAGGIEVFRSLEKKSGSVFKLEELFRSHPFDKTRIQYLEKLKQSEAY